MTTTPPNANDVLMGGGGVPAVKFMQPGDTVVGRIMAPPQAYQVREYDKNNPGAGDPKTYPSGDPIMGVYVDIATDLRDPSIEEDDGTRRLYLEGRYIKADVAAAVRLAGASGLEVGGTITLTFTHREDPDDKRSRKFWQAAYTPAGNAALMGVGGQPAQTPAAPSQVPAQPVSTPTPAAAQSDVALKAKQLAGIGWTVDQIAPALGLAPDVVAILLAA